MDNPANPSPGALPAALDAVAADHDNWHLWVGVTGEYYARRLKTSPPITLHASTATVLRVSIEREEAKRS
jgi:hypothetical protein